MQKNLSPKLVQQQKKIKSSGKKKFVKASSLEKVQDLDSPTKLKAKTKIL